MPYIVKAPLVIAKNEDGADLYVYEGAPVPDGQSDEWVEHHLRDELIAEVKASDLPSGDVSGSDKPARSRSSSGS